MSDDTPLTAAQADLCVANIAVARWATIKAIHRWPRADRADLASWANEGLMMAARDWEASNELTFVAHARMTIRRHMIDCWRRDTHRGAAYGRELVFDHTSPVEAHPALAAACASVELGYEALEDQVHAAATIAGLGLTDRERHIIVELGCGRSLRDLGRELGISEARVGQLRKAINARLPVNIGQARRCLGCNRVFDPQRGTRQAYCSPDCRRLVKNARRYTGKRPQRGTYAPRAAPPAPRRVPPMPRTSPHAPRADVA